MAGNPSSTGGKSQQPRPRQTTPNLNAAPVDPKAQPNVLSASVIQVGCVRLSLVDSHTLKPISGAAVLRLNVEHGDDGEATTKILQQATHALLRLDRPMPAVYTRDDQKTFKTLSKAVKSPTARPSPEQRKQHEALIQKQRTWAEYAAMLQGLTKLVCAYKGKSFKPNYTGKSDGSNWTGFETDILAPIYQKLSGNPYNQTSTPADVVVEFTRVLAKAGILSDTQGHLYIPVPAGMKGSITLEMAHIKVTNPADADVLGPDPVLRAQYDLKRGSYDPDQPGSQEEKSRWRLELSSDPKKFAPLRNFLKFDYDARKLPPDGIVATHKLYGMVWCQPTWFEPTATVAVPGKVVIWDAGTDTPENRAKRGMKGDFPTLVVSTGYLPHSRAYGIYSAAGRIKSTFEWKSHFAKGEGSSWHVYRPLKPQGDVLFADFKKQAVAKWLREYEPVASDRKQYQISHLKVTPGSTVNMPEQGTVTVPKGVSGLYECRQTCSKQSCKSAEEALEIAVSDATHLAKGKVPELWPISKNPAGEWLYTPAPGEPAESYSHLELLLGEHPVIVVPKWHRGIDCAGDVGDPVFATCGGRLDHKKWNKAKKEPKDDGGHVASVTISRSARATGFSVIQTLHMEKLFGTPKCTVKAGDLVGTMGRTGNPTAESPTHAHFQCKGPPVSLTTCPLPGYEAIFPHNEHPKLLPCGADKWLSEEKQDNALPTSPKQCKAIPAHSGNQQNTFFKQCWATALDCCPHGKAAAAVIPPPTPKPPKKCSITALRVVCGHDRAASPQKGLQVVADTTGEDSLEHKLPCGITLKGTRTRGGNDTLKVEVDLEDQTVVGNRFVRMDKGEWLPIRKGPLTLDLPGNESKGLLPRGAPQRVSIVGKGCDDKTLSTLVDVYPGNQLTLGGSIEFDGEDDAESGSDLLEKLKSDLEEFYSGGLGIVKFTPELSASVELSLECGWAEGDDWRAMFKGTLALEFLVTAEGEVSVSLAQIAGLYFGVPPKVMSLGRMVLGDVEVVFGLSFEFGVSEVSAGFGHYSDRGWENEGVGELGATGALSLLARCRVGSKYFAAVTLEAGGEQPVSAKGSISLGSEGIFLKGEAGVDPLKATVKLVVEGWFFEETYSGEWDQLTEPKPLWSPEPYVLWKFDK